VNILQTMENKQSNQEVLNKSSPAIYSNKD